MMTVVGVLALAASANAQGTWYTDQLLWQSLITNTVSTADYNIVHPDQSIPWVETGVTATTQGDFYWLNTGALSTYDRTHITFSFTGNAFAGLFGLTDSGETQISDGMNFSVDGSLTNVYSLTSTTAGSGFTFLGYISDSASDISVKVSGASEYVTVDSFSRASGTNPAGASVAPEPGTLALAVTGGCALVGMYIRRRRISN